MSDLDFSHNVKEIPAAQALPNPLKRSVGIETQNIPDIQGAVHNYAENTNWMSNVGSYVAAKASDALATKLGGELGKNPQGDLGIPLTDFDKVLRKSYETQAQTTLGNQANKLITDSNIELASSPRVTPDLIASTNKQVTAGLQSIFKNAPQELRPSLELHYGTVLLNQNEHLVNRMLGEQKEDRQGNLELSVKTAAQNTYSFGISNTNLDKNGDSKAALDLIKTTEKMASVSLAMHDITPLKAKVMVDTVRQSYLSGKTIREGLAAEKVGKLGEYEKKLSERTDISNEDREAVLHNFSTYFNNQKGLRADSENLISQQMHNRIISDPTNISGLEWAKFEESVSPLKAEQMKFHWIQALKSKQQQSFSVTELIQNYGSGDAHARASTELKNAAFFKNLQTTMKNNPNMTQENAAVQVAMSAGAPVPVFVQSLNNNLTSGNPENIDKAANQIQSLKDLEADHALIGVSKQAEVIAFQYNHQKGSMPDSDFDESMQKTLDNIWNLKLSAKGAGGIGASKSLGGFALREVNLNGKDFGGKSFEVLYGNDIYEQLRSNFDSSHGDYDTALKMTQEYVDKNYSQTRVNGGIHITDRAIEKSLGYKDTDVVPFIQQDLLNQMSVNFEKHKDEKNEYWSIKPVKTDTSGRRSSFRKIYPPAEIVRHVKTDKGVKDYSYPINLVGRPGNAWDVVVQTPTGPRNLFLVASNLGITTYTPNQEEIRKNYNKYVNRGWF
jgi:hypothetical protein